jgi:hypothetical protein
LIRQQVDGQLLVITISKGVCAHVHVVVAAQARDVQLEQRRKANRDAEAVSGVAEGAVPKGNTPWERVISVCNFNAEGLSKDPFKELSRWVWGLGAVVGDIPLLLFCLRSWVCVFWGGGHVQGGLKL